MEVLPIEDSFNSSLEYQNFSERYYTPRYCLDVGEKQSDYCVLFHSNKICVITLAPSHPILVNKKKIVKINFQISTKVDRLSNKVSGKGKHGAQKLQPSSPIFFVECSDGSNYSICSCVPGKLVEINEKLIDNPNLLVECPSDKGYIAVVLPPIAASERYRKELLTVEQYKVEMLKREQQKSI